MPNVGGSRGVGEAYLDYVRDGEVSTSVPAAGDGGREAFGGAAEVLHGQASDVGGAPLRVFHHGGEEVLDGCGAASLRLPSDQDLELLLDDAVGDAWSGLLRIANILHAEERSN